MANAQTELVIDGMTCASCVGHVTRALERVAGVTDATVNLATERASIGHSAAVSTRDLIEAVQSAGYGASAAISGSAAEDADARRRDREILRKRRLLIFAVALFVPTMALGMFAPAFAYKDWVMLALTVPVWGVVGWNFHRGAIAKVVRGSANMDTLVSLGSTSALAYSVYATIAMRPTYYETASAIVTLIFLGKYLETAAKGKTNSAIRGLLNLRPHIARVKTDDSQFREIPADEVRVGDELLVPAGERIPVDGIVVDGRSAVDVSALTGEPLPQEVEPGADVRAGTINGDGTLFVRATAVGSNTTLARIIEIVRQAQGSAPPVQRLADRIAGVFVPVILVIAALTFVAWLLLGHSWVSALTVSVAVLVVACPCALGLATPMAVMVGVGLGTKLGILFKDAESLERMQRVDAVVFDKTGTLTKGRPSVSRVIPRSGVRESDVLAIAAALERNSSHPLAEAVVRAAADLPNVRASEVMVVRGRGIKGIVDGKEALAGNLDFMTLFGVSLSRSSHKSPASTAIYVAHANQLLGVIQLEDVPRDKAHEAITALRELGVESFIVSGDAPGPVHSIASQLNVPLRNAVANASPEEKAAFVRRLQHDGHRVAFVGDGINDAAALASADVGIAMGAGADIAMETASAAILSNEPRAVAASVLLSRATMRTIRVNLFWAFAYNVVLIPLASAGIVHPIFAAAAMGASSLFVVGNSLLLRGRI